MNNDTGLYAALALLCDAWILTFAFLHWRQDRLQNPELGLNFRLTDLWAATLGLSPALWTFALLHRTLGASIFAFPMLVVLIPHQIAGMFIMAVRAERGKTVLNTPALRSFASILGGALIGLLLPLFSLTCVMAIGVGGGMLLLSLPLTGPLLLILYVLRGKKKQS